MANKEWQIERLERAADLAQSAIGAINGGDSGEVEVVTTESSKSWLPLISVAGVPVFARIAEISAEELREPKVAESIRKAGHIIGFDANGNAFVGFLN